MTRGTLAYITYDEEKQEFVIHSSTEFNGDMGVGMSKATKVLNCLKRVKTVQNFRKIILDTIKLFNYDDEIDQDNPDNGLTRDFSLSDNLGKTVTEPYTITRDQLSRVFNFSDYEYVMNLSDKPFFLYDQKENSVLKIKPNGEEIIFFCFGDFIGKFNIETGIQYIKDDDDDED